MTQLRSLSWASRMESVVFRRAARSKKKVQNGRGDDIRLTGADGDCGLHAYKQLFSGSSLCLRNTATFRHF
jgi:hypothetical protein